jgi:imidazolonepropionase-like amidohydrolase
MVVLGKRLAALCALGLAAPGLARAAELRQEEAQPAAGEMLVVHGERVFVRPGEVLEGASVLVGDGRILAVGRDLAVPEGARELSAPVVCAGFFDAWAALGMSEDVLRDGTTSAATRSLDGVEDHADEHLRREALRAGVTSVRVQSGAGSRVAGIGAVLRVAPDAEREDAVVLADADVAMNVGLTVVNGVPAVDVANLAAATRPMDPFDRLAEIDRVIGALESGAKYLTDSVEYKYDLEKWEKEIADKEAELEKGFKKAQKDREKEQKEAEEKGKEFKEKRYKEDRRPKPPKYDEDDEIMARVVDGQLPLVVQAHRYSEIKALLEGTAKFDRLRLILAGGTEALGHAETLAARRIPVLLWPAPLGAEARPDEYEDHDLALAGRLAEAGVEVLIGSGGYSGEASRDLPLLASLAIGQGLDRQKALEALTLGPARAFDVADRVGSIERGKDADLLLLDGEPLVSTTRVLYVIAGGRLAVTPED